MTPRRVLGVLFFTAVIVFVVWALKYAPILLGVILGVLGAAMLLGYLASAAIYNSWSPKKWD